MIMSPGTTHDVIDEDVGGVKRSHYPEPVTPVEEVINNPEKFDNVEFDNDGEPVVDEENDGA